VTVETSVGLLRLGHGNDAWQTEDHQDKR
jgi:hypothetical protein